jgi:hypothetical protein
MSFRDLEPKGFLANLYPMKVGFGPKASRFVTLAADNGTLVVMKMADVDENWFLFIVNHFSSFTTFRPGRYAKNHGIDVLIYRTQML